MNALSQALNRQIDVENYLLWSTAAIPLMFLILAHIGADILLGFPFILANSATLLLSNRLIIHRNHLVAISAVFVFSLWGASQSSTSLTSILAQLLGISVISIYFFSALTTLGPSVSRWLDMYARIAFWVAVFGIFAWAVEKALGIGDGRLKSLYAEPSNFVYTTLPALGYFINSYLEDRRYGPEAAIFILSYILSDSSLGFLGLILVALLVSLHRMKGWQIFLAVVLTAGFLGGLYFASGNFRLRARNTVIALATQNISKSDGSTYAFLSNGYVATRAFLDHPLTGVGIGGYSNIYDSYISGLEGIGKTDSGNLNLNKDDANSLFFRVAAELGLPGLITLIVFLVVCARVRGSPYRKVRNALLPYLIVRMSRFGAYFSVEIYFFVALYVLNYLNYSRSLPRPGAAKATLPVF